jgi:hypothetical protein
MIPSGDARGFGGGEMSCDERPGSAVEGTGAAFNIGALTNTTDVKNAQRYAARQPRKSIVLPPKHD